MHLQLCYVLYFFPYFAHCALVVCCRSSSVVASYNQWLFSFLSALGGEAISYLKMGQESGQGSMPVLYEHCAGGQAPTNLLLTRPSDLQSKGPRPGTPFSISCSPTPQTKLNLMYDMSVDFISTMHSGQFFLKCAINNVGSTTWTGTITSGWLMNYLKGYNQINAFRKLFLHYSACLMGKKFTKC